jgi:DNA-binding response OmpR family regulator
VLNLAFALQPDLLILDPRLPTPHGDEGCRRLKSNAATRHIPILILTALSSAEAKLRGFKPGADDDLARPCDMRQARETLPRAVPRAVQRATRQGGPMSPTSRIWR